MRLKMFVDRCFYEWTERLLAVRPLLCWQLDLVCGRSLYRSHAQMTVMLGSLVGSQVFGLLADM